VHQLLRAGWLRKSGKNKYIANKTNKTNKKLEIIKRPKARPLIIKYLQNKIGVECTRQEICKASGINPNSTSVYSHMKYLIEAKKVTTTKKGKSLYYIALPSIKTNDPLPIKSSTQEIRGQVIQPPINIPALDNLANNDAMDIGAMVNQIVAVNQQNQLYRQAFEGILHIFEQLNLIDAED